MDKALDAGRELAFDAREHQVEAVEGADAEHAYGTALGGVWVHVAESLEVGGVFQVAEQRQPVPPGRGGDRRGALCGGRSHEAGPPDLGERGCRERKRAAAKEAATGQEQAVLRNQWVTGSSDPMSLTDYVAFGMHRDVRARLTPAPAFTFPCMPIRKKATAEPGRGFVACGSRRAALFFRRPRQIERLVGKRVQEVDHVGALALAREAREG